MLRVGFAACVIALCLAELAPARAESRLEYGYPPPQLEPPPPSGIGAMSVGFGAFGFGALNLVTIPICYADFYPGEPRGCVIASVTIAGVAFAVGIPSLIVGFKRHARFKAWRARQVSGGRFAPWVAERTGPLGLQYALRF
jgi:hypothetical protein